MELKLGTTLLTSRLDVELPSGERKDHRKKKAFKKHIVGQTKTGCLTLELAVLCIETRG